VGCADEGRAQVDGWLEWGVGWGRWRRAVCSPTWALALALALAACGGGSSGNGTVQPAANTPPTLTGLSVAPATVTVPLGGTRSFTATATYSDGSTASLGSGVAWTSSPTNVLGIVASSGLATGRAAGAATVTATFGGLSGTAAVQVQAAYAEIAAGKEHTLAVKEDGTLWGWGRNHWGQLGNGGFVDASQPVQVGTENKWRLVAVGQFHSLAIKTDGTLWAWGLNESGQLGDGTAVNRSVPVKIGTSTNWVTVAAGDAHSVARQKDGTVWAWGRNAHGQLGLSNQVDQRNPVKVGAATDWESVSAAANHTVARKSGGTLWAWGRNEFSQLGVSGGEPELLQPTLIDFEEELWRWIAVATGPTHTLALRSDGALFSWGAVANGRLGRADVGVTSLPAQVGADLTWVSVSAGGAHSLAIRRDGSMWAWGANDLGQLGDGSFVERWTPTQVGTGDPAYPATWSRKVRAGSGYSTVLASEPGALWTWGDNGYGQLGLGMAPSATPRTAPSRVD
jgi:alpha-tubulin suppressor-like RCC1 family protein